MAISLEAFRNVATKDTNVLELKNNNTTVQRQGTLSALFGKVVSWLTGTDQLAEHKAVKQEFVNALRNHYGARVLETDGMRKLLEQLMAPDDKPLTAYRACNIMASADFHAKPFHHQKPLSTISSALKGASSYEHIGELYEAATQFGGQVDFRNKKALVLEAIAQHVANPDPKGLRELSEAAGPHYARFAGIFGRNDIKEDVLESLQNKLLKTDDPVKAEEHIAAVMKAYGRAKTDVVKNMSNLTSELLQAENRGDVELVSERLMRTMTQQCQDIWEGEKALKELINTKGLPQGDVQALRDLKSALVNRLDEISHPEGPFQQLIAFAAMAAQAPEEFLVPLHSEAPKPIVRGTVSLEAGGADGDRTVRSAYEDIDALRTAAANFREKIGFKNGKFEALSDLLQYINQPDEKGLKRLRQVGGEKLVQLGEAFKAHENDGRRVEVAQKTRVKENAVAYLNGLREKPSESPATVWSTFVGSVPQTFVQHQITIAELLRARDVKTVENISRELVGRMQNQMIRTQYGVAALADASLYEGLSLDDKVQLRGLHSAMEGRLEAMGDPEGGCQKFRV
ncbi:hypothetical protein [Bordetella sp. 15P40C-2]|uniref:hypothetical protein n=1 Tax=Bordetella sp. 15P40C-2 TaxID=2572246 RepID=UPI00132B08A7|nr:hypothetical protein [Bordetella sp. 15P40C-2]MVW70945.1 hypothetical protein [Bordetella sp. 15P40C-2]